MTTMAGSTPARLKVILGENNIEKLTLPNGIPESLEDLLGTIKTTFGLKDNLRLQYMDQDFGNDFFDLNSTTQLQNLGTVKINTEFQRLMAVPLEGKFMAQLDVHSSQLIKVIRAKGGATRQKIANIMDTLDQDCGADDVQRDLDQVTMAVFVIRKEGEGLQEPPADIGIVTEGVEVLHELTSVASACALLLGLIYALNLAYPKPFRFTFEVLQKIFMQLDQHKMSPKVQNLYIKLQSSQ
ncbi:hypothetical protein D5F01_LYC15180 [Larimichthys crocea]|uniref:Uncharacterized protein n=1 Tax=Larimichthys crocea TaxID=215358 RepID=A0A6G0I7E9_LARCR|nr:hypothetical protein D5F01_LYC15180 [Larimichthys crocea]